MMKKFLLLLTVALLTSSCSIYHINSENTTEHFYPERKPEDIVYLEQVQEPYEIIGIVTVNGERRQRKMSDVIDKMKREAALLGGNAITDIQSDATGPWKKLPAQQTLGNAYVRANYTASVVLFGNPSLEQEDLETGE